MRYKIPENVETGVSLLTNINLYLSLYTCKYTSNSSPLHVFHEFGRIAPSYRTTGTITCRGNNLSGKWTNLAVFPEEQIVLYWCWSIILTKDHCWPPKITPRSSHSVSSALLKIHSHCCCVCVILVRGRSVSGRRNLDDQSPSLFDAHQSVQSQ